MFKDLKIIELASVLAGPSVGQFFSELGAQVLKVESPKGGDVTRSWKLDQEKTDDRSSYFCSVNWGKQSLILDLNLKNDREKLYDHIQDADIVIASYKPGDAEKLKVDYDSLRKVNPQIIYGKITGFGNEIDRVGYDAIIQAESGFMNINGEPDGEPLKMPVALMDILAAHQLKEGLLLALIHKIKTGEGSEVEVSLIQAALASLANQATNYLIGNIIPGRLGSAHPNIAPYGEIYYSKENVPFVLAIGSDRQFELLCKIINNNIHTKKAFSSNENRVANRTALKGELNAAFKEVEFENLEMQFLQSHIPYGRIRNLEEALNTPYAKELTVDDENLKSVRVNAFKLSFYSPQSLTAPPHYKK